MLLASDVSFSLAASQLSILGVYILIYHYRSKLGLLCAAVVFSLLSYLIGDAMIGRELPIEGTFVKWCLHRIGNVSPFLIWILALRLFDDGVTIIKVHPIVWAIAVSALILRAIGSYFINFSSELGDVNYLLTYGYSQIVIIGFTLSAIFVAIRGYRSDLILERRNERLVFVLSAAGLMAIQSILRALWVFSVVSGEVPLSQTWPYMEILYFIYAYVISVFLFFWKFRATGNPAFVSERKWKEELKEQDIRQQDLRLMEKITKAMEEDKLWKEPRLTVPALAKYVDSQEYLVRRAINNYLGFRNISDYLNSFRIHESSEKLINSDEQITNIGLDVGYASLSSFYKAFKEKHGVTPREFRLLNNAGLQQAAKT